MMINGADDTQSTPFLAAPYSFFLAAPFFGARERYGEVAPRHPKTIFFR